MTLGLMSDGELDLFNRIRKIVALRSPGGGVTLKQLGDVSALAKEIGKDEPDPDRLTEFTERLGVELEEIRP